MSKRMFYDFQKKNMAPPVNRKEVKSDEDFCITIHLRMNQEHKPKELDRNFVKTIEHEYAVKYLEHMGIETSSKNIKNLLKSQPLSSCELLSDLNNSGSMADILYIYPNKKDKKSYENNEEFEQILEGKQPKKDLNASQTVEDKEENVFKNALKGISQERIDQMERNMRKNLDRLPEIKKRTQMFDPSRLNSEETEDLDQSKKKDMNLSVDYWKYKFTYPFADIAPLSGISKVPSKPLNKFLFEDAAKITNNDIKQLIQEGYEYPMDNLIKEEWIQELKRPLNISVDEILKDLAKFCKEFPIECIPHMSEAEQLKQMENKQLLEKAQKGMVPKEKPETLHNVSTLKPSLSNRKLKVHYDSQ